MLALGAVTALALAPGVAYSAEFTTPNVTVGQNLETPVYVRLKQPAPPGGLEVKLTSDDPARVLLSKGHEDAGAASIVLRVSEKFAATPEFYVHGLAGSGTATYRAEATGYDTAHGNVNLVPSAIVVSGPAKFGNPLITTSGGWPAKVSVYTAQLDPSGKFVAVQQLRGGFSATVQVSSSDKSIAVVEPSTVKIEGGNYIANSELRPVSAGNVNVSVNVPQGFTAPAQFSSFPAELRKPNLGITDHATIGNNLQVGAHLTLGQPAPPGGAKVTLTSADPSRLLLSTSNTSPGSKSITVTVPANGMSGNFVLQALGDKGTVSYSASAEGYQSREVNVYLAPSGVIITGPTGAPDEAEVLRPHIPLGPNGFFASKADPKPVPVVIYMVQLDPTTHRGADITVQELRAGISLKVDLVSSNPATGDVATTVTVQGGSNQAMTYFKPKAIGETDLSVKTPQGYTTPTNATVLKGIVKEQ